MVHCAGLESLHNFMDLWISKAGRKTFAVAAIAMAISGGFSEACSHHIYIVSWVGRSEASLGQPDMVT